MNKILEVKNVSKNFAGVQALKDVSMEIYEGEIHCLAGENGSGKSTLIKIVSGVYEASEGEFLLNGNTYTKISPNQSMKEGVQVIYQDFALFPNLTVAENIAMNSERINGHKWVSWKRIFDTAKRATEMIGFEVNLNEKLEKLTVADKQLVAICRAIINDAKLLIMDEPTTALTRKEINKLFEIVKGLQAKGMSILFVSHKLDEVFEISERFTILRSGEKVITSKTSELDNEKFIYYMTGRELTEEPMVSTAKEEDTPIIEVKNMGMQKALKDINFTLRKGEILGIAGLLGSGRTELALTLFGYFKATEGEILMDGKPVKFNTIQQAIANGVGLVPEDRLSEGLIMRQTIENNMTVSTIDEHKKSSGSLDRDLMRADVDEWIKNLSIKVGDPEDKITSLSGGNQQKVVLSKWLMEKNLKLLILNGPTVGVDIGAKFDIHGILKKLSEEGLGIIIISDDIPELLSTCSRILIMRSGRLTDEVDPHTVTGSELMALMTADD